MKRFRIQLLLPTVFREYPLYLRTGNYNLILLTRIQEWNNLAKKCSNKFGVPNNSISLTEIISIIKKAKLATPLQTKFLVTENKPSRLASFFPTNSRDLFNPLRAISREVRASEEMGTFYDGHANLALIKKCYPK